MTTARGDRSAESRSYYLRHKAEIAAKQKRYYEENRPKAIARVKAYADQHRETIGAYHKEWRSQNQARIVELRRTYSAKHREKLREKSRLRHHANKKKANARRMDYHRAHPECLRNSSSKRRAIIKGCAVDPTGIKEWMRKVRSWPFTRCHWCGTKVKGKAIHFDHVIALSIGGDHSISNLCASCQTCNRSKSARAIGEWLVQGQTFLTL